jgi:transposase
MLRDINSYDGIYLACGVTDLRKAVDGLATIVKNEFNMNPFGNYLFMFCNRNRNRLKCLSWDRNGFVLYYKRLDGEGAKFIWPKEPSEVKNITVSQLRNLMNGMSVDPPRGFGDIKARDFF